MNKQKAEEILKDAVKPNGCLSNLSWYIDWEVGEENISLDGHFGVEDIEAIAWWMRNIKKKGEEDV